MIRRDAAHFILALLRAPRHRIAQVAVLLIQMGSNPMPDLVSRAANRSRFLEAVQTRPVAMDPVKSRITRVRFSAANSTGSAPTKNARICSKLNCR